MSEEYHSEEESEEEIVTESTETSLSNQQEIEHIVDGRLTTLQEERAAGRRRMEYIKFAILAVILLGTVLVIALLRPTIFDRIVPAVMGQTNSSGDSDTSSNPGYPAPAGEATAVPDANTVQNLPVISVPGSGGQESGGEGTGGQEDTGTVEPTAVPAQIYVVQAGDTLNSIARQFNSTVAAIVAANNIQNPDALQVGATLTIPQPVQ